MANLTEGLSIVVLGMTVVFSVLLIIMVIMLVLGKTVNNTPASGTKSTTAKSESPANPNIAAATTNDEEILAVLTAAALAFRGGMQVQNGGVIGLRSYRPNVKSRW